METQSNLMSRAKQLLKNRPVWMSFTQIEAKTGLPKPWIALISQGKTKNSRADRLEKLIEFLESEAK